MKKILFVSPSFFGYYKPLIKEMENEGYTVDWYRDIPSESKIYRAVARVCKFLVRFSVSRYLNSIVEKLKNGHYEKVIFIYGMTFSFSAKMIMQMKNVAKNTPFVIYLWDSLKNLNGSLEIINLFDKVYSFDKSDISDNINFLPLFYTNDYLDIVELSNNCEHKYFCSYVGTAHPKKVKLINEISEKLKAKRQNQFIYHYMPSKLKYIYHKIFSKEYRLIKYSDLQSKKLSTVEIQEIIKNSFCVLDAPQAGQSGLTIRTIEMLGADKKLITCNNAVKTYDFYNPTNIYVYDEGEEIDFSCDFFTKPYEKTDGKIKEKYSIKSFVSTLLS